MPSSRILHILFLVVLFLATSNHADAFLLWEATRGEQTIHVLAVVPLTSSVVFSDLANEIKDAYHNAERVVFESDQAPDKRRDRLRALVEAGTYPTGETIHRQLPRRVLLEYGTFHREMGTEGNETYRIRPWLAAQQVLNIAAIKAGIKIQDDLAGIFHDRCLADGKETHPLSTNDEILDFYSGMSLELQVQMLQKALKDARTIKDTVFAMEQYWTAGRYDQFENFFRKSYAGHDALHAGLFASRNQGWVERLKQFEGKNILVLTGAAHLAGKDSLLENLKQNGFSIRQFSR
ncbi:MAG TPA: TraB/GumN family protein [Kiritimatiellia bacterium]|nr:TraB/GumN family protein [Kiritimatiellia bacterium]